MPKQVVRDVFGELLETGKQTAAPAPATDRMEGLRQQRAQQQQQQKQEEEGRKKQIEKLKQMDKDRSRKAYEEIQQQIRHYQKIKASQPRKYVTAAPTFDQEQVEDPEGFMEKMKKKAAKAKEKFLPWTSKKGMGTGEIRRGVSG